MWDGILCLPFYRQVHLLSWNGKAKVHRGFIDLKVLPKKHVKKLLFVIFISITSLFREKEVTFYCVFSLLVLRSQETQGVSWLFLRLTHHQLSFLVKIAPTSHLAVSGQWMWAQLKSIILLAEHQKRIKTRLPTFLNHSPYAEDCRMLSSKDFSVSHCSEAVKESNGWWQETQSERQD